MRWNKLVAVLGENQVAHLTACVYSVNTFSFVCVPKPNGAVRSASAGNKEAEFMRRPSECLDGSGLLVKFVHFLFIPVFPNEEFVVVPSAGKGFLIEGPFQAADFLFVADVLLDDVSLLSVVPDPDLLVLTARGETLLPPGDGADPGRMLGKVAYFLELHVVIDLQSSRLQAHWEELSVGRPTDGGDHIVLTVVAEFNYFVSGRVPQVHTLGKSHWHHILNTPVKQVQVKVVLQLRRVQHLERSLADVSRRRQFLSEIVQLGVEGQDLLVGSVIVYEFKHVRVLERRWKLFIGLSQERF